MLTEDLINAIRDLRYLLNRGYPRESAMRFVSDHYRLPLDGRHLLARCVFSEGEVRSHRAKVVDKSGVKGRRLGIDGYNVLITIESILRGEQVIRCDDGLTRDLRAIFGKYRMSRLTPRALRVMLEAAAEGEPMEIFIMFDSQVSRSGELAAMARRRLKRAGLKGDALAVPDVDLRLREFEVVASSDRAIVERADAIWDIPGEILKARAANVLNLMGV